MIDYTLQTLEKLINEIKWFDIPFRLKEIFKRYSLSISELQETVGNLETGSIQSISGDFVDNTDPQNPVIDRGYKIYKALLTQSGTDAPVATIFENSLGNILWSRASTGLYNATLIGAFTENKTVLPNTYAASIDGAITATFDFFHTDENTISIRTRNTTGVEDDNLIDISGQGFIFEIKVYN